MVQRGLQAFSEVLSGLELFTRGIEGFREVYSGLEMFRMV